MSASTTWSSSCRRTPTLLAIEDREANNVLLEYGLARHRITLSEADQPAVAWFVTLVTRNGREQDGPVQA